MIDLTKWNHQTLESVRHVLDKAGAPCIGFTMVFMDMVGVDEYEWTFKTMLSFDPHNPPPAEERKMLEKIFEGFAGVIQQIMSGGGESVQ